MTALPHAQMLDGPGRIDAELLEAVHGGYARGQWVFGLCGAQGSGKSTRARVLQRTLATQLGLTAAVLSLDDLYLSGAKRARLASTIHPLLRTRGVPGTHDAALGIDLIQSLRQAGSTTLTRLPRFDKLADEPLPSKDWSLWQGRPDLLILEGWCLGAAPQPATELAEPVNELERLEDADGRWRRYVNEQLGGVYATLFSLIDHLTLLRAPGFDVVFDWREEQERELAGTAGARAMSPSALRRFIRHYERLTRHILAEMPSRADLVIDLDGQRRLLSVSRRERVLSATPTSRPT